MSFFTPAENQTAFLKSGLLGFQGSGKTFTATKIAIGLHKYIESDKPVAFLDTETGSDWAKPQFDSANISLVVSKTRAFRQLLEAVEEAEKECSILIIDSVSHFWNELLESYQRTNRIKGKIPFHHWGPIKKEWRKFSDYYVNSKLHIVLCGRAGWEFDMVEDGEGGKDLIKTGTKMKAEGEFGFEPDLLIEMERIRETTTLDGKPIGKIGGKVIHRAHVIKDRRMDSETLDGSSFDNPGFEEFLPHIKALNLGGDHVGVDTTAKSDHMFEPRGESWQSIRRRKDVLLEEIDGMMGLKFSGQTKEVKQRRAAVLWKTFGTHSHTQIESLHEDEMRTGLEIIRSIISDEKLIESALKEAMASISEKGGK